jgi:O-acetyl-ADP-ribose deacetylase (regulator of RNase III)
VRLEIVQGDITREHVDAIVNAANESLLGGGGVDGAIHRAGGPTILEECRRLGGCATGDVKVTGAGNLDARYALHAVGPVWRGGTRGEPALLASCYRRALELARSLDCRSIAFPAISTGVYGYPPELAATVALQSTRDHAATPIELVRLVCFSDASLRVLEAAYAELGLR